MEDDGSNTNYLARVLHKNLEESRKHEEMGFHEGWETTIDQLGKVADMPAS